MHWRRLDVFGREHARVTQSQTGWRLSGDLEVTESNVTARLRYVIDCDRNWRTRYALIEGEARGDAVRFELEANGEGQWMENRRILVAVAGALDIDLGFTPATNTLPIRRLALEVGERADVRSAWLRFPELRLEALEQTYAREADRVYRYVALVDDAPFEARLDIDAFGRVIRYEGLWEAESAIPALE